MEKYSGKVRLAVIFGGSALCWAFIYLMWRLVK